MFVGYAKQHGTDVYDMWDPMNNILYVTRDIIWLRRWYNTNPLPQNDTMIIELPNEHHVSVVVGGEEQEQTTTTETPPAEPTRRSPRKVRFVERYEPGTGGMERKVGQDWSDEDDDKSGSDSEEDENENEYSAYQSAMIGLTDAEERFYGRMKELGEFGLMSMDGEMNPEPRPVNETAFVGAAAGGGFENTAELKPMKFDEAMRQPDKAKWLEAVEEEYKKMEHYKVWKPVKLSEVPKDAKILTTTWAMKKKSNGTYRARLNARGFEQEKGIHYNEKDIASPVVHDITVRIVLTLMVMASFFGYLLDVSGAFLNGRFDNGERMYVGVPQGFEKFYPPDVLLLLGKAIYGSKQGSMQFWKETKKAFDDMEYKRSKADPCMYFKWIKGKICIWLTWVDDCLIIGDKATVIEEKEKWKKLFECDDVGELKEYVGCKIDYNKNDRYVKLTQPVMIQSFRDEYDLPDDGPEPKIPAEAGTVLTGGEKPEERNLLPKQKQTFFRSGIGKLLHMMRWSRPEVMNRVRECSRYMSGAVMAHIAAMKRTMRYVVATPNRGLTLKPFGRWDGSKNYEFVIEGWSDSEYAKDASRRSVNGWSTFLNGAPVSYRSKMMPIVALSVTEAELFSAVLCAQDMLFVMRIVNSLGLRVKLPMKLNVDNKGMHDLSHNWSVGGRTRHVEVKQYFLREMKEMGLIEVEWKPGPEQRSDIFTKNLQRSLFEKHGAQFFGQDEYMMKNVDEGKVDHEQGRVSDSARGPRSSGQEDRADGWTVRHNG